MGAGGSEGRKTQAEWHPGWWQRTSFCQDAKEVSKQSYGEDRLPGQGSNMYKTSDQSQVLPVRRVPEANAVEQRDGDGEQAQQENPSQAPSCQSHRWETTQTS